MRPRQHPVHRRAVRALARHQDHLGASRKRRRLHGRRLLPRLRPADRDLHLVRAGLGQSADLARQCLSRLGAVHGGDRQRADQPVQPRRLPGTLPPLPGRLPVDRALLLQEGVPADARRDGAARGPAGLEDHGDRAARARSCSTCRSTCSWKPPPRKRRSREEWSANISSRCGADPEGVVKAVDMLLGAERPVHHRRAGRALRRRQRRAAAAGRAPADSGGGVGQRPRRHRHPSSARARTGGARRPLPGQPRHPAGRRAAGARRALRRPHLELLDSGLLLHHPADPAHSRRHRSGGDRPQLSGGARPDGGCAHLPAPGAGRTRPPRRPRQARRRPQEMAAGDRRLSQGMGQVRRARLHRRHARRSIRSAPRWRSTRACPRTPSWSATSACTTIGCSASASPGVPIH